MDNEMMGKLIGALNDNRKSDSGEGIYVSSLHDAIILLQRHMNPEGARYRKRLVEYMIDPSHPVKSECDVYHNFVMDLFRVDDYDLALQVCEYALTAAPYNRDMLGDAIKACGDSSQFEKGEEYLKRALDIPYPLWSFRLYLYSVDFLKTKLSAFPMDEALYHRALELADLYIKHHPYDEHGYNQKAELLIMMNERDKAIVELGKFILHTHPDPGDNRLQLVTAQCCVTLLNILDDSSDYDYIIQICDRGLQNTTQEQPSAAIGYFVYRKALALDAKAHSQKFETPATTSSALRFYQSAYDLNQDRSYARTIEKRYAVLRPYAADFQPLIKRDLFVTADQNGSVPAE